MMGYTQKQIEELWQVWYVTFVRSNLPFGKSESSF
jgi:hypothetical protein